MGAGSVITGSVRTVGDTTLAVNAEELDSARIADVRDYYGVDLVASTGQERFRADRSG